MIPLAALSALIGCLVSLVGGGAAEAQAPAPTPSVPPETSATSRDEVQGPSLRGRAQFDALIYSKEAGSKATGTQVRRLYLGAEGDLTPKLSWIAEADFSGGEVKVQDAYLAYQANPGLEFVLGHFKVPVTSEDQTSDNHTVFLERSAYAGTFAPGRRLGLGAHLTGERWGVRGGLFGENADKALDGDREESWLLALRGHVDVLPGQPALHLGVSAYHHRLEDRGPGVRLSQKPENGRAPRAVDTGMFQADNAGFLGAEAGFGHGPLTVQLEGGAVAYEGPIVNPRLWGWSAQAAWRWTGEARSYDAADGVFGRVRPRAPLGKGGFGAVETALRLGHLDLSDDVEGGEMTTYGAVVNWLPVTHLRLSANLIQAEIKGGRGGDIDETLLALRAAVDW